MYDNAARREQEREQDRERERRARQIKLNMHSVSRSGSKKIRNICYFEANDCNPLNAIEYILEDGQPFFDAVVLFAGNINWNASKQKVYMNANPNVQALLDN